MEYKNDEATLLADLERLKAALADRLVVVAVIVAVT